MDCDGRADVISRPPSGTSEMTFHPVKASARVDVLQRARSLTAVDRAVQVLEALERQPCARLAQVARDAGLSDATTLRYLNSLIAHDFVERDPGAGTYRHGMRLFRLGQRSLSERDPRAVALPYMERLHERFEETVNLAVRNGDDLVLIEVLQGSRSIRRGAALGDRDVWHASALGKAVLAHLPTPEAEDILERHGYERMTARTRVSWREISRDLSRIAQCGYAVEDREFDDESSCVGSAIFAGDGRVVYALSVSGPSGRFGRERRIEIGEAVREAAGGISGMLGYVGARASDAS
jgi:DNA-binding IclR family transcriptional regulator